MVNENYDSNKKIYVTLKQKKAVELLPDESGFYMIQFD